MTTFNNALCQFKHALCYTRKAQVSLPGPQPLFLCSCVTLCKACPSLEKKTRTGRNYAACLFVVPWLGKPFYEVGAELRLLTVTLSQVRPKDPSYSCRWSERELCVRTRSWLQRFASVTLFILIIKAAYLLSWERYSAAVSDCSVSASLLL